MMTKEERKRFEDWAISESMNIHFNTEKERYISGLTNIAFSSFKLGLVSNRLNELSWEDAEKLAGEELVADALTAFSHDSTDDNAVGLVRYIVESYNQIAR